MTNATQLSSICLCLLGLALADSAHAQIPDQTLTIADRTKPTALTRDALLARPETVEVTIARDPVYGRAMHYRAIAVSALLKGLSVGDDDYVQARATDDFSVSIPARLLLQTGDVEAFVAIEPATAPWPAIPGAEKKGTAGPFYIVWRARDPAKLAGEVSSEYWSYHLAALTVVDSPAKRWPALAVGAEVPEGDPVRRGLDRFVAVCMACHRFAGAGEATMGPDLARPMNPVDWVQPAALKKFIRDPKSVRNWPEAKMPAFDKASLSDNDIDALVAWLAYKAKKR
jgi:mono/diheme cytochrome c family protein